MSMLQLRDLDSASGHGGDPVEFEVRRILTECIEHVAQRLPYAACGLFFDFDGFHPRRARCHVRRRRTPGYVPPLSLSVAGPFLDRHPDRRIYSYSQMTQLDPESPRRRLEQEQEPEWDDFVQMAFWDEGNLEAVFSITWTQQDGDLASHAIAACEHLYPEVEQELKRLRRLGREQESTAAVESFMEQLGEPIMLVGFDGRTLFANALAREACGRWNLALKADDHAMPDALVNGLQDIADTTTGMRGVGEDPMREACVLKHPREPSLAMHVSVVWKALGLRTQPFYTLRFLCQGASSGAAAAKAVGGESEKARALRSLSPRERQIALLVAEGLRNEEIANRLVRSRRTIEFQIASVYRKLDLSGRVQLARLLA